MKKSFLLTCLGLLMSLCGLAQSTNEASFSVHVNYTEVGLNENLSVTYTLKNAQVVGQFVAPNFNDFTLVAGPMVGQQMTSINGQTTNSMTYTYTLRPNQLGAAWIPMATVETTAGFFSTQELAVNVVESTNRPNVTQRDNFFGTSPFENDPFFQGDLFDNIEEGLNFRNMDEYMKDAKKKMEENMEMFNEQIEKSREKLEKELEKREQKKSEGKTYKI